MGGDHVTGLVSSVVVAGRRCFLARHYFACCLLVARCFLLVYGGVKFFDRGALKIKVTDANLGSSRSASCGCASYCTTSSSNLQHDDRPLSSTVTTVHERLLASKFGALKKQPSKAVAVVASTHHSTVLPMMIVRQRALLYYSLSSYSHQAGPGSTGQYCSP